MKFTKMQGCGNDYVYIYGAGDAIKDIPALARRVSDRHFGIGSDGLILIDPAEDKGCDFQMRMYNADGSQSAMCGNGSRCVGKYVYDYGHTSKTEISLLTGAGVKYLTLYPENGKVQKVRVDMGEPELRPKYIPCAATGERVVDMPFEIEGSELRITCVSMGNPHVIMWVKDTKNIPLETLGPKMEHHPFFPERTNVEFAQVISRTEMNMRVWERGSGETWACGTGTCATVVAGILNGLCERCVLVHLLGGDLTIEWGADNHVYMTGPAVTVFDGELYA